MNPVQHFEIPFDDKNRAYKFYETVFGWKIQDMPEVRYAIVHTTETDGKGMAAETNKINGGLMKRDDTAKSPVIVITVKSIDDKVKEVEAEGGKIIMPKVVVGDMGYYTRVKDTEGNTIGIWEDR